MKENDEVVADPSYESELNAKFTYIDEYNLAFLKAYEPAAKVWHEAHKGASGKSSNPPIYKDKDGRYFWANRHERRKAAKLNKNKK